MMSRDEKVKMEIKALLRGLEFEYQPFHFSVHTETSFHASGTVLGRIAFMVTHHYEDECHTVYRTSYQLKDRPLLSSISHHAQNAAMNFQGKFASCKEDIWDKWRAIHTESTKGGDQ